MFKLSLSEKAEEALMFLGLSRNEIKAYVALLNSGPTTASEVSKISRIPYSKVYDALESLRKKGIVTQQKSRPVLFTPKPPDTALNELRLRYEEERKEKEKIAFEELNLIFSRRSIEERPEIWILRGSQEIVSRIKNLLLNCRNELLTVIPEQIVDFVKDLVPIVAAAKERGVKVMILTSTKMNQELAKHISRYAEIRFRNIVYGGGVIADGKEVVLLLGSGKDQNSTFAIWAQHPSLAAFAKDYFAFLWNSQDTIELK